MRRRAAWGNARGHSGSGRPRAVRPGDEDLHVFEERPPERRELSARIVRSAADGDLVWLHVHSTNGPKDRGQAVLDVFRLKGGHIVEHWNVTQDVPAEAANQNTMF